MKVMVIEPHPDDFWLNCGGWARENLKPNDELLVVTVFTVGVGISKSIRTAIVGDFVDCLFKHIDLREMNVGEFINAKVDYADKETKRIGRESVKCSLLDLYDGERAFGRNDLFARLDTLAQSMDKVFAPMGMSNAAHNVLSQLCWWPGKTLYYREFPYFWNRAPFFPNAGYVYKDLKIAEVYAVKEATIKWRICCTVYPDQMGFLVRDRPYYRAIENEMFCSWDGSSFVDDRNKVLPEWKDCIKGTKPLEWRQEKRR